MPQNLILIIETPTLDHRVWGSDHRVLGSGFGGQGLKCRVLRFRSGLWYTVLGFCGFGSCKFVILGPAEVR